MLKKLFLGETFVIFMIMGVLDCIANIFHLYWSIYEFDSIVHFFGGAALSLFFSWFYFFSGFFNPPKRNLAKFLLVSIFGAMFVAVSWEVYELLLGEAVVQKSEYLYDTMMDLVMSFLGALAACLYTYLREEKLENRRL